MDPKNLAVLMQLKQSMEESTPKPARRSSNELSEESIRAIQESVKRRIEEGGALQNPKMRTPPDLQRRECISCKEVYAVEPDKLRPYWKCTHCRHLKKQKQREEAEARTAAQYVKATSPKIKQLEQSIAALKSRIAEGIEPNQRDLMIQLRGLEKKLSLEKVHAISKIGSIRARKVPGSYGSTR